MTCTVCPNCGFDLERLARLQLGDLDIPSGRVEIRWKGKRVPLTVSERLIVAAIARADGLVVSHAALAEILGYEGDRIDSLAAVYIHRIRLAFRLIDPEFDRIDTGGKGRRLRGARWRMDDRLMPAGARDAPAIVISGDVAR